MARIVGVDKDALKRVTCLNCASIVEYSVNDTYEKQYTDYSGCTEKYRILNCPKCSKAITVSY